MKTRKVMELSDCGMHLEVIKEEGKNIPYRVVYKWYRMGWHRKTLVKYSDISSCLAYIAATFQNIPGATA